MARQVLPVVGAAVGFYFGGPTGAQIGWMVGSLVGNAVDPQVIKGPSIGDLAQQTSQEGVPRAIVFGLSVPMAGNLIYSADPKIVKKKQQQGKGGGPVTETESVYRTYAIGVCEGPITQFVRVWRNGVLVYDVRPNADPSMAKQNAEFLKTARFFLGAYDQGTSPDIEAIKGVGDTPFFRGTAYLVMANEDLTDLRGAVPQFAFQVLRCEGSLLSSRPYPVEVLDTYEADAAIGKITATQQPMDKYTADASLVTGDLVTLVRPYTQLPADFYVADATLVGGEVVTIGAETYSIPADTYTADASLQGGTLVTLVQSYTLKPDSYIADGSIISGTLT